MGNAGRAIRGADLFCGSGGFSTGLVRACEQLFPGRELDLVAVNHWQVAIDTHQANHPNVRHFCADLEHLKPRDAVPGGVLDILLAAPSCTYHSRARGGRPVYDQQRMDPWHVVRWCTDLRVHRLIVENVPEFMDWGPCDTRTGKPIKARKGEYFRAWLQALRAIGMRCEHRVLTCADYGDATTRERFFLYGRSDKRALRFPEPTHAPRGAETDLLGARATWRSAADIIDWSNLGTSIFTRKRPLVANTLTRLRAGAERNHWPKQHIAALQALINGKTPRLKITAREAERIAAQLGIPLVMATGGGGTARGVDRPMPTITGGLNGITPHFAEPVIMATGSNGAARPVSQPVPTITTGGATNSKRPGNARPHFAQPIILHKANSDGGRSARGVGEPVPTVTTNGAGALVRPILTPYYGGGSGRTGQSVDDPLPAQGTKDRFAVATPFLVPNFGERPGQGPRTHDVSQPMPTIAATGHIQIARPFVAHITHHDGSNRARPVEEPLPTVTGANRGELALAQPAIADGYYIDVLYRMLHWKELARATSFEDEGKVYHFTGTATDITKQVGNAVPIRTGTALCVAALDDMRIAA